MENPIKAILIGAGNRGMMVYGQYALDFNHRLKFVAVAEPIKARRKKFAKDHKIISELCFERWEDLLDRKKFADVAVICTQDNMHVDPTTQALDLGYDVLLEKPMASNLDDCIKITKKVEESGRVVGIGHVLRYTDFFLKIYEKIHNGKLGNIINISHRENVSWYHMAHSFVRGNWSNKKESSPMILAKCCHDLDLLYWLLGKKPLKISSFGSLAHFRSQNMPKGAPDYCVEGCPIEDSCLYYAPRIYIDIEPIIQVLKFSNIRFLKFLANLRKKHKKFLSLLSLFVPSLKRLENWREWPVEPLISGEPEESKEDFSKTTLKSILRRSKYGRCVYKCDNDVVDHQVVNLEFEDGITANLTMHGFSEREGRTMRIDGTKATLMGSFRDSGQKIVIYDHFDGSKNIILNKELSITSSGHGGGDYAFIDTFIETLLKSSVDTSLSGAQDALESHLMAFAADKSRLEGTTVLMEEFRRQIEG